VTDPDEQLEAVVRIVREVLGGKLVAVYLHGSTGAGRMMPTSDLDVLAVVREPTTLEERREIVTRVMEVSGSPEPRGRWRPVELTIVVGSEVNPWRYPPMRELQYGEWDRERYRAGFVPGPEPDPDLALLIAAVLHADRAVVGPPAAAILAPVPPADLRRACLEAVPGVLLDLVHDTRNYLLTLARIWLTLATGEIRSKDEAAAWALARLPDPGDAHRALALAREQYLAGTHGEDAWAREQPAARAAAQAMVAEIDRLRSESP